MQTYKITDQKVLEKLRVAFYQFKAIEDLYHSAKNDINPITPKWEEYMLATLKDFQQQYDAIINKIAYENAPFENFTYCVNLKDEVINYCES